MNAERRESIAVECEQQIKDMIASDIIKNFSMLYTVQFHNIESEEIFGKTVCFKLDQSFSGLGMS
jgi:hypothetical protein